MKKHIYEESNRLSYTMHGDYYLPDLVVNEEEPTYGKYGMLRKQFLKVHRPARYQYLLMTGELTSTLESSCSGSQRTGENYAEADGGKTGCDGTNENAGSDEMGWFNE